MPRRVWTVKTENGNHEVQLDHEPASDGGSLLVTIDGQVAFGKGPLSDLARAGPLDLEGHSLLFVVPVDGKLDGYELRLDSEPVRSIEGPDWARGVTYKPPRNRALLAIAIWATIAVLDAVEALNGLWQGILMTRLAGGDEPGEAEADLFMALSGLTNMLDESVFWRCAMLLAVGALAWWVETSYSNLVALGVTGLKSSPYWVAAQFFVPILQFYRPAKWVSLIWKSCASKDPLAMYRPTGPRQYSAPIAAWWGFWLGSTVLGLAFTFWTPSGPRYERLAAVGWVYGLSSLTACLAALFTVLVIRAVTRRQEEKARAVLPPTASPLVPPQNWLPGRP
jgi:hypothetical protein